MGFAMKKAFLLVCFLFFLPPATQAAALCDITGVSGLNFGMYDSFGPHEVSSLDTTGTFTVSCNGAADNLSVTFSQGQHPLSGSSCALPLRSMRGPDGSRLAYNIYSDPSRTTVWGCTPSAGQSLPKGRYSNTFTVYGRIPAGQTTGYGTFSDNLIMTVTF